MIKKKKKHNPKTKNQKKLNKMCKEGTDPNTTKAMYDKPISYIILKNKQSKIFSLCSGVIKDAHHNHFYSKQYQKSQAGQLDKVLKNFQIRKKKVKLSLFSDDMIIHIENSKDATKKKKKVDLNKKFGEVTGYKMNIKNKVCFFKLMMKYMKKKLMKQSLLKQHQNNKILWI